MAAIDGHNRVQGGEAERLKPPTDEEFDELLEQSLH